MAVLAGDTAYFDVREDPFTPPPGTLEAIADINGDGLLDIVMHLQGADETDRTPLVVALGLPGGGFSTNAPVFAGNVPGFMQAKVLVGDYTGDGITDMAVYDAGWYDWSVRTTRGGEPVLFVGNAQGQFTASDAIKVAAQPFVQPGSTQPSGVQVDLTMGVKDVVSADIDGDGDLDFWVESTGSHNISGHFLINEGGTFTIDLENRLSRVTYNGPGMEDYWRYGHAAFLDVNSDGAPDLVLGQIRDNHPTHLTQSSFVVLNDGNGYFPQGNQVRLPLPDFYYGYTSAEAMASWDINRDGRKDLVLVHTRNDDVSGDAVEPAWTGTYIQVLIQQEGGDFTDESAARIGSQTQWSSTSVPMFEHARSVTPADLNGDGITDFILGHWSPPAATRPSIFLGQADGTFALGDNAWITGGDPWFGERSSAVNVNGDAWTDFIHLDYRPGANGVYDAGGDDFMTIVTQLGTGPLGGGGTPAALRLTGTGGNDTMQGGAALDTMVYDGSRHALAVTAGSGLITVNDGINTDTLVQVERIEFADGKLAFDENAADVAMVLGAVFGAAMVESVEYAGIGLSFADAGMDITALMRLALDVTVGAQASNDAVVDLLYTNVVGAPPDAATRAGFTSLIESGAFTQASLGVMAATHPLNLGNIDITGLAAHGLAYV